MSRARRPSTRAVPAPPAAGSEPGHNTGPAGFAADHLRAFVERIERLEEEKATIRDDIKDVYAEAKGTGFDTVILRQVIRIRKQDAAKREEQEAMLDLYLNALGMRFAATPIGRLLAEPAGEPEGDAP